MSQSAFEGLTALFTHCRNCGIRLPSNGIVCPRCRTPKLFGRLRQRLKLFLAVGVIVGGVTSQLYEQHTHPAKNNVVPPPQPSLPASSPDEGHNAESVVVPPLQDSLPISSPVEGHNAKSVLPSRSPDENATQHPRATTAGHEQQLLKAKQILEEGIANAKTTTSKAEDEEIEHTRREEQAAMKDLLTISHAYPRSPEIAQKSYEAGKRLGEIQRQYQDKYSAIRNRYGSALGRQQAEIEKRYEADVAAIKSGGQPASSSIEAQRPAAISYATQLPNVPVQSPSNPSPSRALCSIVGVSNSDTLNVRSGPGETFGIVAKLPNGYTGLQVDGVTVMNGTTEWVKVEFGNHTGWVTKGYLRPE